MQKRERLERTIAGEPTDRTPVALWRHFPGDDQRAVDLAAAVVDWQRRYDWDFVKVTPANTYNVVDYALQERWQGDLEGMRTIIRPVITKSLDWTNLRVLDPSRGMLRQALDALSLIREGVELTTPILMTIPSPLAQARMLAGEATLIKHLRTAPDRLRTGLNTLTDSTLRLVDALRRSGLSGLYYSAELATYTALSEAEYREFGRPYDLRILEGASRDWWLNILHLQGELPMFDQFRDYPVQAINWQDRDSDPTIDMAKLRFKGALCAGLGQRDALHDGTPVEVRSQARNAMEQASNRRLILSAGCVTMVTTPLSNLKAARGVVEPGL
jgi:uroporphyrinogen decarboxylase